MFIFFHVKIEWRSQHSFYKCLCLYEFTLFSKQLLMVQYNIQLKRSVSHVHSVYRLLISRSLNGWAAADTQNLILKYFTNRYRLEIRTIELIGGRLKTRPIFKGKQNTSINNFIFKCFLISDNNQ